MYTLRILPLKIHSVWKSFKKSHFTTLKRAKRTTFVLIFCVKDLFFCLHSTRVVSLISNIGIFRWKFKADIFFFFKKILRSSTLLLDQFDASKCNASSSLACPGQLLQTASHFPLFLLFVSSLNYFVLKKISISILITYLIFIFDQKCIDFFSFQTLILALRLLFRHI